MNEGRLKMKKRKYAIIDIETTGGIHNRDKITEIAIIVTDGQQILSEYQSLVNPERSIPYHITNITGIDNEMVVNAPKFYEIAKDIIEITEGTIFVAHNVKFDYGFIKEEFKSLGYSYNRKRLCTVKLSRSTIKGLRSYGLDSLIKHFDLQVDSRHRAYDDTLATYKIFKYIHSELSDNYHLDQLINEGLDASILPRGLSMDDMHAIPETPGVYFLSGMNERVLYVGKAKDIKTRLFQHFRGLSRKSTKMYGMVQKLHYIETGHELMALLLELHEIKRLKPELNKALKRSKYPYALYHNTTPAPGKPRLIISRNNKANDLKYEKLKLFGSKGIAEHSIGILLLEYQVCSKYVKSRSLHLECHCEGNCNDLMDQSMTGYQAILKTLRYEFEHDFIILLDGRTSGEKGFVMIHNNSFWGIGYIPLDATINSREQWNDYIDYQFWYPEASGIVKTYLAKHKCEIIKL